MDILTGTGLAASAGLNAYIPLLTLGLLDRYTSVVNLGPATPGSPTAGSSPSWPSSWPWKLWPTKSLP